MQRTLAFSLCLITFVLLTACSSPAPQGGSLEAQANYWQQVGSTVGTGESASLASDGTSNTIAFSTYDGTSHNVYVKRWNGSSWVQLGGILDVNPNRNAFTPSLALDSSGNPVVSWRESPTVATFANIYVKRWNGSNWIQLGGILNSNEFGFTPSLALDSSGNPVVSWQDFDDISSTFISNIHVKRWNGSSWVQLGGILDVNSNQYALNPSLTLNSSGNPVVSWTEFDGEDNTTANIYVKRWNGSSWIQLGGILDVNPNRSANSSSLALNSSGNPVVSWSEFDGEDNTANIYVKRWNGSSWVQLGGILDVNSNQSASSSSLALYSSGNPVVSWRERDGDDNTNLYVKRWNGSSWVNVGVVPLDTGPGANAYSPSLSLVNGSLSVAWQEGSGDFSDSLYVKTYRTNAWQDLGPLLDVAGGERAINSSIARTTTNQPVVAWDETDSSNGSRNVYVKEWSVKSWILLGGAVDRTRANNAENPSLALRSDNRATVAFQENNNSNTNVYVRRWSGTAWVNIGGALDTSLANDALTPSLALDKANLPVVAYAENGDILVKKANGVENFSVWNSPFRGTPLDITASNEAFRPSLALKSDNNPIVAWYEDVGTSFNIYAKEWTGTSWIALGRVIDNTASSDAKDIVLAIRSDNRPVVAWEEAGNIYVKHWTGTSWVSLGETLDKVAGNEALRPALDLRTDNDPVVSWQEWNGSSYDVWVKRWKGSAWTLVGSVLDKSLSRDAERPALVLKSDNNPIVSWDEWDGSSETVYVRQY